MKLWFLHMEEATICCCCCCCFFTLWKTLLLWNYCVCFFINDNSTTCANRYVFPPDALNPVNIRLSVNFASLKRPLSIYPLRTSTYDRMIAYKQTITITDNLTRCLTLFEVEDSICFLFFFFKKDEVVY